MTDIDRGTRLDPDETADKPTEQGERVIQETTVSSDNDSSTTVVERATTVIPSIDEQRRRQVRQAHRIIYFVVHTLTIFILIRFVLAILGADPDNAFARFIYGLTGPFVAPFNGLFGPEGPPQYGVSVFYFSNLVAIAIYYLFAWIASKIITFVYLYLRRQQANTGQADEAGTDERLTTQARKG